MRAFLLAACLLAALPAGAEVVGNLSPTGDNYLTLRAGPSTKAEALSRMGPGTRLVVFETQGDWRYVATEDGREGWAFGKYILPDPVGAVLAPLGAVAPEAAGVLAPAAGPAVSYDPFDWVEGHMAQFHDPLKYFP